MHKYTAKIIDGIPTSPPSKVCGEQIKLCIYLYMSPLRQKWHVFLALWNSDHCIFSVFS